MKDPSHPMDIPATEAELCCAANLRSLAMLYFDTLRQNWDAAYDAGTGSTAATLEPTKAHLREGLSNQVKAPVFWCVLQTRSFSGRSAQVATPRHFRESKRSPEHISRNSTLMGLSQELSGCFLKHLKTATKMHVQGVWLYNIA